MASAARFKGLPALITPPVIAGLISASLLTAIHMVSGTPELLATIALPLTVATSYAALYTCSFWAAGRRTRTPDIQPPFELSESNGDAAAS